MHTYRVLTLLTIVFLLIAPVSAGERYLYGSPELSVAIAGTNEFDPGETTSLVVVIENEGLNTVKIVQPSIVNRDDLPNTAKLVSVWLDDINLPLTVKSDSQMIGDILGGASKTVSFIVSFDEDANPGEYEVPLHVEYTYLTIADQVGSDTVTYSYSTKEKTLPVTVKVIPEVRLAVVESRTDSVNVGTEGYLDLAVRNVGHETGTDTIVKIQRNGASPIVPTDGSVYIGEFAPGGVADCRFKIAVSSDAEKKSYPLDLLVSYVDSDGTTVTSDIVTIGIDVGGKIEFTVISAPSVVYLGEKAVIEVVYRNTGAATAYNAQARISAVDPFTSNDDTAYLGDVAPGESVKARFEVSVSSGATLKTYGLDSEIGYRDALNNRQITDTMKVEVVVEEKTGIMTILTNPIAIAVVVFALLGAGYYLWKRRNPE